MLLFKIIRLIGLLAMLCTLAFAKDPAPLEELDAILTRHKNIHEFLSDEKSKTEYFEKLKDYMGGKLERSSYDAILSQLKQIDPKVPGLTQRLWETTGTGERFSITNTSPSFGRELNYDKWNMELRELRISLKDQAGEAPELKSERLLQEIRHKEKSLVLTGNAEQKRNQAAMHFKEIRSSSQVKELAAHYAERILRSSSVNQVLLGGQPDLVLNTVKDIKDNPRKFLPPDLDLPGSVISEIKELLPDQNKLLADKEMFPEEMIETRKGKIPVGAATSAQFDFVPLPRRFHGIWKGIPSGECVGGACGHLDYLTPERWATVAIADSQIHYVEKAGKFSGFVEALPGEVGGKTFASLSFGAPDLNKKITVNTPGGTKTSTTLYEEWLKKSDEKKPKDWAGYVVSQTTDINHANNLSIVRTSDSYRYGTLVFSDTPNGPIKAPFQFQDPLVKDIVNSKPEKASHGYSRGAMITDATTKKVNMLTQLEVATLDTDAKVARLIDMYSKKPQKVDWWLEELKRDIDYIGPDLFNKAKPEIFKIISNSLAANERVDWKKIASSSEIMDWLAKNPKEMNAKWIQELDDLPTAMKEKMKLTYTTKKVSCIQRNFRKFLQK